MTNHDILIQSTASAAVSESITAAAQAITAGKILIALDQISSARSMLRQLAALGQDTSAEHVMLDVLMGLIP